MILLNELSYLSWRHVLVSFVSTHSRREVGVWVEGPLHSQRPHYAPARGQHQALPCSTHSVLGLGHPAEVTAEKESTMFKSSAIMFFNMV